MSENDLDKILKILNWKEVMWPIDTSILRNIPLGLLPDIDSLTKIKYPWELLVLLRDQLKTKITEKRVSDKAQISSMVEIAGPVWIEEGVLVYPFSVIIGPAYIGRDSIIGNFTQIRESFIGGNSLVGERTSLVRSVIGKGCHFHRNYLGDSLLAENVDMGGGTTTANFRLDHLNAKSTVLTEKLDTNLPRLGAIIGKNTRFGTTCQIMPGVKIGNDCFVGPRSVLYKDLANNSRTKVIQQLQIVNSK